MASPRIDDGGVVYLGADASLVSYSVKAGTFQWTYKSPNLVELGTPPPAITDTVIFTEGTEALSVWQALRNLPLQRFVEFGREAYDLSGNRFSTRSMWFKEQWLLAIDRRDGHLMWQQPLGVGRIVLRNNSGTPVVSDNRVFISSPVSRIVSAFDAATGRPLWKQPLDAMHVGAVTVVDNDLILGDHNGDIILLRGSDGVRVGRCHAGAPFSPTAPVIVGKTFFAATRDGWVYATPYDSLRSRATRSAAPASCF
jgi:outer membrane protein assembly factor BamB